MPDLALNILLEAQNNTGGAFSGLLQSLGPVGAGIAVAGAAIVGFTVASIKMAADYQQGMNMVQALTGASTQQMAHYDAGLKQLAVDAGVAPTELTKGLYQVVSANYSGAEAMRVLTLATEDSKIGMTDEGTVADALTNVLKSFSKQTTDATLVNGIMLETVTLGKSTFEQYASTISKAATTAAQYKVSLQTMSAAWATMTANGIKAKQATVDFVQLTQSMDGKIGTVTKSLHSNGVAFNESKFNAMDYGDKVQYLNSALQESIAKHKTVTGVTLQAAQALQVISQHIDTYNSDLATLSNSQVMANKTAQAWAITQSGFNQTLSRLNAAIQIVMINIGTAFLPILTQLVNSVVPLVLNFGQLVINMMPMVKAFMDNAVVADALKVALGMVVAVMAYFAVVGVQNMILALLDFGLSILTAAAEAVTGAGIMSSTFFTMSGMIIASMIPAAIAIWSALWPVLAIGAAIIALVVIVKKLYDSWTPFRDLVNKVGAELRNLWDVLVNKVGAAFSALGTWIQNTVLPALHALWDWLVNKVGAAFSALGTAVNAAKAPIGNFFSWLGTLANGAKQGIGSAFSDIGTHLEPLKAPIGDFFSWLGTKTQAAKANSGNIFSAIGAHLEPLKTPIGNFFSWLGTQTQKVAPAVGDIFSALGTRLEPLKMPISNFFSWLGTQASKPATSIGNLFSGLGAHLEPLKTPIGNFFSWIGTIAQIEKQGWGDIFSGIGTHLNAAKTVIGNFFSWIGTIAHNAKQVVGNIFSGIGSFLSAAKPVIGNFFSWVGTQFNNFKTFMANLFGPIFAGLAPAFNGIKTALGGLGSAFSGLGTALGGLKNTLGTAFGDLKKAFQGLWDTLQKVWNSVSGPLGGAFSALGKAVQGAVGPIQQLLKSVGPSIGNAFSALGTAVQSAIGPLQQLFKSAGSSSGGAFSALGTAVQSAVGPIKDLLKAVGPALGSALKAFWQAIQPLLPALKIFAGIIGGLLISVIGIFVSALVGILTVIAGVITGVVKVFTGIVTFITGIVQVVSGIVQFFVDLLTGHFNKLSGDLGKIWDGIKTMALGLWTAIQGAWEATIGAILSGIGAFVHSVITFFQNLFNTLVGHSIIPDMINAIIQWFASLPGKALSAVGSLASGLGGFFSNLAGQAVSWGQNLITGFINGVKNMAGNVGSAVSGIAGTVKKFLGFGSPTEAGPGSTSDTWAPNLMNMFSQGLMNNIPNLQVAVNAAAQAIQNGLFPDATQLHQQINSAQAAMIQAHDAKLEAAWAQSKHKAGSSLNLGSQAYALGAFSNSIQETGSQGYGSSTSTTSAPTINLHIHAMTNDPKQLAKLAATELTKQLNNSMTHTQMTSGGKVS